MTQVKKPKVFISYSWSSPEHQEWVLNLALKLHEDNIHPIIDKWDLREGQSAIDFMESMIVDPSIDKIIMIIDNLYQEKADTRGGGVGTESTILSNVLYNKKSTTNIVSVIAEPGAKPPVFYSGRIFVDLSSDEKYIENYENLVRWIYGKFKHERPTTQGTTPSFIHDNDSAAILYTNTEYRFALDAIEKGRSTSQGIVKQYLNKLLAELPKLSIDSLDNKKDAFQNNFHIFSLHLLEYKKLLNTICEYNPDSKLIFQFKRFLEESLVYSFSQEDSLDRSLFQVINYLLFLTTITILLKNEEFLLAKSFLDDIYEVPANHPDYLAEKYSTFRVFSPDDSNKIKTILDKPNYVEPLAELIKISSDEQIIKFNELCETDVLLYLKSASKTIYEEKVAIMWWPHLSFYINSQSHPLKIFAKAVSPDYLAKICNFLNCTDIGLVDRIIDMSNNNSFGSIYIPRWNTPFIRELNIKVLTNYKNLKIS